jgi:hypothetical protein
LSSLRCGAAGLLAATGGAGAAAAGAGAGLCSVLIHVAQLLDFECLDVELKQLIIQLIDRRLVNGQDFEIRVLDLVCHGFCSFLCSALPHNGASRLSIGGMHQMCASHRITYVQPYTCRKLRHIKPDQERNSPNAPP